MTFGMDWLEVNLEMKFSKYHTLFLSLIIITLIKQFIQPVTKELITILHTR